MNEHNGDVHQLNQISISNLMFLSEIQNNALIRLPLAFASL